MERRATELKCCKCKLWKPDKDFPRKTSAAPHRRGRDAKCRRCKHDYYIANRERMAAQTRAANIKRRYGLTVAEYEDALATGCLACGSHRRLVMDHCHRTGRVRGALCTRCNAVLGAVRDDADLLRRLADHLEGPNA